MTNRRGVLALLALTLLPLSAGVALVLGWPVVPIVILIACLLLLREFLGESNDMLDPRVGFVLAVLVFLAIPNVVAAAKVAENGGVWQSASITHLAFTAEDLAVVEVLLVAGLGAVVWVFLQAPGFRFEGDEAPSPLRADRLWLIYFLALGLTAFRTYLTYGGFWQMLLFATQPALRNADLAKQGSGLAGLAISALTVSAFYLARHKGRARLLLFLAPLIFVLPGANRASVIQVGLAALTAATGLRPRRPFAVLFAGCVLLPPLAGLLVAARNAGLGASQEWSLGALYTGFAEESSMIPTFALAVGALRSGAIHFNYGLDAWMLPLWFFPRALWPGKPLPLDFRLNEALGLNDGTVFGTPLGIFGGFYVNFTWLGYVPALMLFAVLLLRVARKFRHDRLATLFVYAFVIDIVRVGDLSREVLTASISFVVLYAVRALARSHSVPVTAFAVEGGHVTVQPLPASPGYGVRERRT